MIKLCFYLVQGARTPLPRAASLPLPLPLPLPLLRAPTLTLPLGARTPFLELCSCTGYKFLGANLALASKHVVCPRAG